MTHVAGCPLCEEAGGHLVFTAPGWRVIRAAEPGFPAFYRVVWTDHVAEFSDLSPGGRAECMEAVACVEGVLRRELQHAKVNLAALGNMVPHLHWHVIARFDWDTHFPGPVWAQALRSLDVARTAELESRIPQLDQAVSSALRALASIRTTA